MPTVQSRAMRFLFALLFLGCVVACQSMPPRSTSESPRWKSINLNLPLHAPVLALAVNPTNAQTLYAATYDNVALYRSDDAGATWRADNQKLPRAPVFALLPTPAEMFAATADGLYWRALRRRRCMRQRMGAEFGKAMIGEQRGHACPGWMMNRS